MQRTARLQQVTPSISATISTKAQEMRKAGIDVCNFSVGEPDFDTPEHIKEAAKQALDRGETKYSPPAGNPRFRELIADKLRRENQLPYQAENIIVTNGGKQSLFNLILALIESGDEVVIPSPYWVSYPEIVKLANGIPVIVPTQSENDYKITAEQLQKAISPQTKLLILNSPSNPTGSVYTPAEIHSLAEVILEHNLFVISDEIYEKILYAGATHLSIGAVHREMLNHTAVSGGLSKSHAMTGWRLGYIAAPVAVIQDTIAIQSHSTSGVCTFAQYGGIAALEGSQNCVKQMLKAYTQRRQYALETIATIPRISCLSPQGAFYIFIDISQTGLNSVEFANALLTEQQVVIVPGAAYGANNCIRLSYTTNIDSLKKGLGKLARFLDSM